MLADPRSREFITGFTHQWLHMERLEFFNYNFRKFPEFDESVKESAREEVYHTIELVLRKNRPIGDLLDPDFLVVNDVLRNYYRLGGLQGGEEGAKFEKVKIPENSPRGGLLGMAAILAMGSDGERTSPVERGAWVLRKLLHNPPPPAPPNVPQLSRNADKPVSGRELLKLHNEEAQCAQCHQRIDPLFPQSEIMARVRDGAGGGAAHVMPAFAIELSHGATLGPVRGDVNRPRGKLASLRRWSRNARPPDRSCCLRRRSWWPCHARRCIRQMPGRTRPQATERSGKEGVSWQISHKLTGAL